MRGATGPAARDPRLAAWHILGDVDRGEFAERSAARRLKGLGTADRALALELSYGAIRLRARLDTELGRLVERPLRRLDPRVLRWLRLGLYQIRETRIPDHAAVDETVRGVRATAGPRPAGLANAVLRRAARERPGDDAYPDPDRHPAAYLAAWGSHPDWLIDRWLTRWPLAAVRRLVENDNRAPPVTIRVLDGSGGGDGERVPCPGVRLVPEPGWRSVYRLAEGEPERALSSVAGVVQDPAAAAVVDYIGGLSSGPVLDACSAPGGKALGLASLWPAARPFVAADVSGRRLRRTRDGVERLGLDVELVRMDGRFPAVADAALVLVDAPCTGTGVLRRRPDARWRLRPEDIDSLAALQWELLDGTARAVRPGGMLVYATCSLEPEENEEQVDAFLERHPDFGREPPEPGWVREGTTDARGDLRVLPWVWDTDGAFASRLRRRGEATKGD